jgi:hypothetical protein
MLNKDFTKEVIMIHLNASGPQDIASIEAYVLEQANPEHMAIALIELMQEGQITLDDGDFESTYLD